MTTKDFSISCIIPMHNEEANAPYILQEAENIFSQLVKDWEIIVIESGSKDNTRIKIEESAACNKRIRAFFQERKEGAGSALRLGYSKATKDLVCHLEADSPFEMKYFKKALPILTEHECVIGYRVGMAEQRFRWSYHSMGRKRALLRQLFHIGWNVLLRLVFGLVVRDANFSFKIFRRECIQNLELISNGWFIDAEILLNLKNRCILPIEMPVEYRDRMAGRSTVRLTEPFKMISEMLAYIRHSQALVKLRQKR